MTLTLEGAGPASIAIRRLVEWRDTDASGRFHHSVVSQWVEAGEAEMLSRLDLLDLFPSIPRVHYEVDFLTPLYFRDEAEIIVTVAAVGSTSIHYSFDVRRTKLAEDVDYGGDEDDSDDDLLPVRKPVLVARGAMVSVLIDDDGGTPRRWPNTARTRLLNSGRQIPRP